MEISMQMVNILSQGVLDLNWYIFLFSFMSFSQREVIITEMHGGR